MPSACPSSGRGSSRARPRSIEVGKTHLQGELRRLDRRANEGAVRHYRTVLKAARELGLDPWVTLHHWTSPTWLHDAIATRDALAGIDPNAELPPLERAGWLDASTRRGVPQVRRLPRVEAGRPRGPLEHAQRTAGPDHVRVRQHPGASSVPTGRRAPTASPRRSRRSRTSSARTRSPTTPCTASTARTPTAIAARSAPAR